MRLPSPFTAILHFEDDVWGLRKTIDTLRCQTRPPTTIIVVDDSPHTQIAEKIREAPVSYVRLPMPVGSVVAFHEGARMANTPWVLFVRGNPWFPEQFFDTLDAEVTEHPADAYVCPVSKQLVQSSFATRFISAWRREAYREEDPWTPEPAFGVCAVRLEAFLESGGFGENMDFESIPDILLANNLAQGDFTSIQPTSIEVIESRRFDSRELLAKFYRRCQTLAELHLPGTEKPARKPPPPRLWLAFLFALLVILPPWNGGMLLVGLAVVLVHMGVRRDFLLRLRAEEGSLFALRAALLDFAFSLVGAAGYLVGMFKRLASQTGSRP